MKEPIFAALLNIVPGLGYLYLGVRRTLSIMLILATVFLTIDVFFDPNADMYLDIPLTPWYWIGTILMSLAFIVDAYLVARVMRSDFKKANKIK